MALDAVSRSAVTMINQSPNLKAFLHLIRTGEGTLGDDGYRTLYGGKLFDSFADHPRIKVKAGKWTSSAAGAYQFLSKTWDGLVAKYPSILTSFSPECQDEAAVMLIKGRGAYADVIAGRFKTAIIKCNKEWASLPLSPYGQPTLTMEKALKIITEAGGQFEVTEVKPQEKDMSLAGTIITSALPKLLGVLPELAATMKNPDVAARNVELVSKVGAIMVGSTGAANEQEAVERVLADPQTAAEVNTALRDNRADLIDIVERVNAMEQGNIKAARDFNTEEPLMINTRKVKMKFWHILALLVVFAALVAIGYVLRTSVDAGERTLVLQTLLLTGFAGVMLFVFGSSEGSKVKDVMNRVPPK